MKDAGFGGVFCNVGDYPASAWEEIIRPRALDLGMFCGPWARTHDPSGNFSPSTLDTIIRVADQWRSPLIVNSESELKGSGATLTKQIAAAVGTRDGGLSMEPWPYANVDWTPVADLPALPQIFPEYGQAARDPEGCKDEWHNRGVSCVYFTFGSYGSQKPDDYMLQSPYSVYTADDCGSDYGAWSPTSSGYEGCVDGPVPPTPIPPDGGDMERIGSQHGIEATYNRLKALDPAGCNPAFDPKKPDALPVEQLKAYDKWCRTMLILVHDHDEAVVF